MNQQVVNRPWVAVVGETEVEASLERLLHQAGVWVTGWHEGLDPVGRVVGPKLVVAYFAGETPGALARLDALKAAFPRAPILALTDGSEPALASGLLRAGASAHYAFPAETSAVKAFVIECVGRVSGFWSLSLDEVDFALDEAGFLLKLREVEAHLTKSEFSIMAYLVSHREQWITARDVLREVLGPNHADGTSLVRVHMHNIRRKLGPLGNAIQVVRGKGYRLELTCGAQGSETSDSLAADRQSA
jgi:DNA-binding response OmpR family regulator